MSPRRSSRIPKPSLKVLQQSLRLNEKVNQPQSSRKRQRAMGLKKSKSSSSSSNVTTEKKKDRDILNIINDTHRAERFFKKDDRQFVELTDRGVDESDEDCLSVNSSIASGPSMYLQASPKKSRTPQSLCSACQKLCLKAQKIKAPMKDKLLDNNPQSLTCDQWVLIKSWRPKRQLKSRGNVLTHVTWVKRRLGLKSGAKRMEPCVREGEQSACSRPHVFLQRNLRRCVRAPVRKVTKKNRRKRKREDPGGSRVAKKQRLHSRKQDELLDAARPGVNGRLPTSSPALEGSPDQEADSVTTRSVPAGRSRANTGSRFGVLLAQLRGNCSMVVRESR